MGDALKGRPLLSVDIIPPSLAILGSWYAENPKDINTNQVGIVGEIQVMAAPMAPSCEQKLRQKTSAKEQSLY